MEKDADKGERRKRRTNATGVREDKPCRAAIASKPHFSPFSKSRM